MSMSRDHSTVFILNSTENEIETALKLKYPKPNTFIALNPSDDIFILLMNVKMQAIYKQQNSFNAELR